MKIGISAAATHPWGDAGYEKLAQIGFQRLDYSMTTTESDLYQMSDEDFEKELLRQKKLANDAGIEFSQVHGPWRYPPRDATEEDRAERMEKMKKSIRGCAILGCRHWVVHPLMPFTTNDIEIDKADETWKINLTFMRELLQTAKEYDVIICLENMPMRGFSIATPADIVRFIQEINDDHFQMCLDTGHVSVFPNLKVGDCVREVGKYIRVLHVHDNNGKMDQHAIPFFGITDWEDFGKALKDIGFFGSFSFETTPSAKLPLSIYEEMCHSLFHIAEHILQQ